MKKNAASPASRRTKIVLVGAALSVAVLATGASCTESSATTVNENLSKEAEEFQVQRKIVGINAITDKVLFLVEGRCSIERATDALIVTCKHADDDYRKHYIGLSDNVTYVATQLEGIDVSEYRTKIILKPEALLPDIDINLS